MRIIFSRKGFDSSSGRKPSPILPDGRMLSFPIPDSQSSIRYEDIHWQEYNLGSLVSDLTNGRKPASHFAHLDPDINRYSLPRHSEWKPIFGQTGAAQGHLQKNGVQADDIFLFFGLFRNTLTRNGKFLWDKGSPLRHILWGWLQIGHVLKIDSCKPSDYKWAEYHPHFHRSSDKNNTLYVASKYLSLLGLSLPKQDGAGVFQRYSKSLVLTAQDAKTPSQWELPEWFYPRNGKCPLTYHSNLTRWQQTKRGTKLNTVGRGQEFILDTNYFPEAVKWLKGILECI
ncbi:MAG: hypothetical protein Q8O28_00475 [Smithellaceae bacterium]|nr:hypothetical protein [Smithellaceae bacterium]